MTIIDNCITKILNNDKNESFAILTFFDFERELFPENIFDYANNLVNDNQILKQNIVANVAVVSCSCFAICFNQSGRDISFRDQGNSLCVNHAQISKVSPTHTCQPAGFSLPYF